MNEEVKTQEKIKKVVKKANKATEDFRIKYEAEAEKTGVFIEKGYTLMNRFLNK